MNFSQFFEQRFRTRYLDSALFDHAARYLINLNAVRANCHRNLSRVQSHMTPLDAFRS